MRVKIFASLVITLGLLTVILAPASASAQYNPVSPVCNSGGQDSAVCKESQKTDNPLLGKSGILTKVVQIIVMFTAVASVIMIMVGGFKYITSTGDSGKVDGAKNTILYAIIGLVVAMLAQVIVSVVLSRL